MKIQTKITLLFIALSSGILILLNAFILYFEYQFNYEDFFDRLETRVNLTAQIRVFSEEENSAFSEVRTKYLEKLDKESETVIVANVKNPFRNDSLPAEFFKELNANGYGRFRAQNKFYAGKVFVKGEQKYLVVTSASNPSGLKEIEDLQKILFYGFIGAMLISFFVGMLFSKYTFAPIRKLTSKVKTITSNNLHLRLEEPKGKDEVAELTLTFNNMLNRLETAFETQNNFVSNASHELRTPLTILSSEIEYILAQSNLDPKHAQSFNLMHAETEKLIQIINSLLLLAQSGFNGEKQNWQEVRIDELLLLAIESVKKVNPFGDINIDFSELPDDEEKLTINGNDNLLRLAINNIISNACKYSKNQLVILKLQVIEQNIVISVLDKGIGIPTAELQQIFEPFYRASNTQEYKGHGVGLPLTLNILRLHGGTIGIRSVVNEGTEIQVMLPLKKK